MARKQCTICTHEERARAELLLAKGDSYASVSRKLSMSQDALERHWKRHVPKEHKEALQPGAKALLARVELAGQIAEENTSSLDHLRAARALLWQMIVEERSAGHTSLATMAAAQYAKVCGLIAKITGELSTSPLVSQTTVHLHFAQDPEFQQLMDDVAEALIPYPEARAAVFAKFAALDRQDEPVIEVPAIEHQPDADPPAQS